ncbi:hypothetical protein H4F05_06550 [Vibrio cholerae]
MKTEMFWQTIQQMADITCCSAKLMQSQGQQSDTYEREQIQLLKAKCERRLTVMDEEVALNRGNGLKPSEKPCEELSHTTSEKQ